MTDGSRFLIMSLPRTGSTTLARLLDCHEQVRCLIEPFAPHLYGGRFHARALRRSVHEALAAIWTRWNGIKHVWDTTGLPFVGRPELTGEIALAAHARIILLTRRNILQRIVSQHLSRQTHRWVGPRDAFIATLEATRIASLNPDDVRMQIREEQAALAAQSRLLSENGIEVLRIEYEDLLSTRVALDDQRRILEQALAFVGVSPPSSAALIERWSALLDPTRGRWATADVYRRIPEIDRLEEAVGSDETGWIFRERR